MRGGPGQLDLVANLESRINILLPYLAITAEKSRIIATHAVDVSYSEVYPSEDECLHDDS